MATASWTSRIFIGLSPLWLLVAGGGCCFWRNHNPISDKVLEGRQLAQQGVNALERQELDRAEQFLAQAVRACPDDPAAHRHYADALWARGRTEEALKQIVVAAEKGPDDAATVLRAGELHLLAGQLPQAQKYVQRSIDLDPKSADAWAIRARLMVQLNNPRQALADAQRGLRFDARRRDLLLLSADVYRMLGDPQRALVNLQALSDTYASGEEPIPLQLDTAQAYQALGRYDDAVRALRHAERQGPVSLDLLTLLCEAEAAAGRPDAARAVAQQAIALAPDDPRSRALADRAMAVAAPPAITLQR